MLSITPSLPAKSFDEIKVLADALDGCIPMLQIDIVDGVFVPNLSWPFTEHSNVYAELENIKTLPPNVPIELDCMVMNPEQYIDTFVALGVRSVIVHMGSTDAYEAIITHARAHGYQIGIAITNDSKLSELAPLIPRIDFVQVMGIAHVGKQGEPFDERTIETLETLKKSYPDLTLVVDGAVNFETIVRLRDAGATRFAPGSVVAKSVHPLDSYKQLLDMIGLSEQVY